MQIFDKSTSLLDTVKPIEMYIRLYFANDMLPQSSSTAEGQVFLQDGSTSLNPVASPARLLTLGSFSSDTQFAFEATLVAGSASSATYAELWDITTNLAVTGSRVSTLSTAPITLRSTQVALVPGHVYGVTMWNNSANYGKITDASLIVFP